MASTDELLALPTFSALLDAAIDQVFKIDNLEDRFAICIYFLKDDTLGYRQNEVMGDLLNVVRQLMKPEKRMDVDRILSRLTRFFRARDNTFLLMRFLCYEAIGVAIGEAGNVPAADHLIEDVLSWKFQYPEIQGATDDWETVVNPFHLPKIRCWMHIIESNPALYERLAAALNVQLRLGGVYIADTDLFQRDVTRFLNADIKPIYFVAKQLLRAFPVYFNDVGAEGELRSVSTELDEICQRHDTLMHFLRKQSHAESSNRLIDFSRAVLTYWVTLDTSGLRPYLSANTLAAVERERAWAEEPHEVLLALWQVLAQTEPPTETPNATPSGTAAERRRAAAVAGPHRGLPRQACQDDAPELQDLLASLSGTGEAAEQAPAPGHGHAANGNGQPRGHRRVALMLRTHQLLTQKYSLSADGIGNAVARNLRLETATRARFAKALASWQKDPNSAARDHLLDIALTILEELQAIILSPEPSTAVENIYQKRHIAAGIPSMYGTYTEPKFDALGLSFRVENLVARLLDDVVAQGADSYVTRDSLRRMAAFDPPFRTGPRDRRGRLPQPGREPPPARVGLRQPQLHVPPVSQRVPVHRGLGHRAQPQLHLEPRPGAPHRARARPAPVRDQMPVARRRGRDRAARGAGLGPRHAGPRPLRVDHAAPDLDPHRATEQPRPHPHDELRPRAPGLAPPPAAARSRRPDDPRLQGPGPQADGLVRPPGAARLHPLHRALQLPAGHGLQAALRRHASSASATRSPTCRRRPGSTWATPSGCSPCRCGRAPPSPCRASWPPSWTWASTTTSPRPCRASRASSGPPGTPTAASCSRGPWPRASSATSSTTS